MESYGLVLDHDFGGEVSIRFVDWADFGRVDADKFFQAHRLRCDGEPLPYVYVDGELNWTGGMSLRDILREAEAQGFTSHPR